MDMLYAIIEFFTKPIFQLILWYLWYRGWCNCGKEDRYKDEIADKGAIYCEPCGHRHKTKLAFVWCNVCDEGYCDDCVKGHTTKSLRDHQLISVDDHEKLKNISFDITCKDHKMKKDFFCCQHDATLCLKCLQSKHNDCEVHELKDAANGTKTSVAFSDLEDMIKDVLHNVKISIGRCKKSADDILADELTIRKQLRHLRKTIDEHLDKLHESLLAELDAYCDIQKVQIEQCQSFFINERSCFTRLEERLSLLKEFACEVQTFVGVKEMDKTVYTHKVLIKDKIADITSGKFELEINPALQSFVKDVLSFGKLISEPDDSTSFTEPKEKQAQLSCSPKVQIQANMSKVQTNLPRSNIDVTLKLRKNICIARSSLALDVTSCVVLPNKKLMFADCNNNRLIIHNEKGGFERFIKLNFPPFDIAILDENTVAVTYRCQKRQMDAIDIHTYKISEFVSDSDNKSYQRWGISCDGGSIYVVSYPEGIELLESSTKTVRTIKHINVHNVFNITSHENKIYYTNRKTDTLVCADTSGSILWRFRDERLLSGCNSSSCLTSDTHGNIYLVGPLEDVVMFITDEGRYYRIVLDKSDKLSTPRGIYFDKDKSRLLVCNQNDGHASLYDVIERNRNLK